MMLSPSASSSTVTSPTPSQASTTAITSPAGQTVTRSPTPKSQTPVRNVFSVHPAPQQQAQLLRPPQQQLQQRAKTQVEVAQAALILSRIEDMKGKTFLNFREVLNNGSSINGAI